MAMSRDWEVRVDRWIEAVHNRIVVNIEELPTEFVLVDEHLTAGQAKKLHFKPIRAGAKWGQKWKYGWFRTSCRVPTAAKGKAVVLTSPGNESVAFINGKTAGGLNWPHMQLPLPASRGKLDVLIESYAGHGPRHMPCSQTFLDTAGSPFPEVEESTFAGLHLAEWNEQAYQLWIDAVTVRQLGKSVEAGSLRQVQLEIAIKAVTCALDVEAPAEEFDAALTGARAALAPVLACHNGDTAPELFCFGHAHIDVAWLWPLAQTYRKSAATFSTALALMARYRNYRFLQSQAQLYAYVKEQYPDIYERIKAAVKRGQWIVDGAMWVESDTNVTGGEAFIRQFMLGKRFFKDEFGVESKVCWLPDVFGYSGNMPQIMAGCGVKYFSTQKIFWNYNGGTVFPFDTFTWEGIDGSSVLAHLHRDYNAQTTPDTAANRWKLVVDKPNNDLLLYPFGWGDGGGGPTRNHLEHLARQRDLEGMPKMRSASLLEFFEALEGSGRQFPRYAGELYFEAHRGTYTSQARTKRGNRKGELALREAELWSAVALAAADKEYPSEQLDATWKKLLLNQFHDILPGSSIGRVYQEAEALFAEVIDDARRMSQSARRALTGKGEGLTVWNSLSWRRDAIVALPFEDRCPVDSAGSPLPAQLVGKGKNRQLLLMVQGIPACGCKVVKFIDGQCPVPSGNASAWADAKGVVLENECLRLRINDRGEIAELFDKQARRQFVASGAAMNRLEMYRDNPADFDAWDLDIAYKDCPVALGKAQSVEVLTDGPLEARVAVVRAIGQSMFRQEIVLRSDSRTVEFQTVVDWQERHKVLKAAFPADLGPATLRGEIQFGHVVRSTCPTNETDRQKFEWPAQKWADLSEADCGLAVLNDCKYGYDNLDGVLRLTLLKSPVRPDPDADKGSHEMTYALHVHNRAFAESDVVRSAYEINAPVTVTPGVAHEFAFLEVSSPSVIVETVKNAEDGQAIVVRLYECVGSTADTVLRVATPLASAQECDLIENVTADLKVDGNAVSLRFRPFEIKTIRLAR
jgi:alpha-mannosidase